MAQKGVQLDREIFSCSICQDLLKDPVAIPCGHSYCMDCIKAHWDGEDEKRIYSCPQCRKTFKPRPVLLKNTKLADVVEELKKTGFQADPADHFYAGPKDVACDVCTGRKRKAVKSCLQCPASYCEKHLQHHYKAAPLKKHKLMEPSKELQESQLKNQQRIQDREKDVKLLQQEVEAINRSADKAVEDSEKMFTELIRLLETRISDVKQQVRSKQETEVSRVKELQEKLEQEITELKRKDYTSPSTLSEASSSLHVRPLKYFEELTAAVTEVRDILKDVLSEKWTNISLMVTEMDVLLSDPGPKTRAGFLKYSRDITLDPNTAHRELLLSEGNRKATHMSPQSYPDHPDRFTYWYQVLSTESLTGCCYWEVEWEGKGGPVEVAVAYKNIRREGNLNECVFGNNNKSWVLRCENNSYNFWYNKVKTTVSGPQSSRVGVYLDHSAGLLSFYSVSGDTMTLLHRVQTTFTQPLHAGFFLHYGGATAELCKVE